MQSPGTANVYMPVVGLSTDLGSHCIFIKALQLIILLFFLAPITMSIQHRHELDADIDTRSVEVLPAELYRQHCRSLTEQQHCRFKKRYCESCMGDAFLLYLFLFINLFF